MQPRAAALRLLGPALLLFPTYLPTRCGGLEWSHSGQQRGTCQPGARGAPGFLFGASFRPALEPYRRACWLLPRAAGGRGRGSKLPGCYGFQGGPHPGSTGSWGGSGLGLTHSNHPQTLRWEEVKLMGPWPIFRLRRGASGPTHPCRGVDREGSGSNMGNLGTGWCRPVPGEQPPILRPQRN